MSTRYFQLARQFLGWHSPGRPHHTTQHTTPFLPLSPPIALPPSAAAAVNYVRVCHPGCSAVGASAGAVDPKTHRKWVWAFIDAVANLDDVVVSKITVWGPVRK